MSTTALSDIPPRRLESEDETGFGNRRTGSSGMMAEGCRVNVIIAIVVLVAFAGLIFGIIGVTKPGHLEVEYEQEFNGPAGYVAPQDRVWTFAVGHSDTNLEYIDEATGAFRGYHVDIVNAVCKIANKKCELIYDSPDRCWTNVEGGRARGGEGILGGWYDVCTGWGINSDRGRTFAFSNAYSKLPPVGIYVANSTSTANFDWRDLRGRKVGFVTGFSSDEFCLARYADTIQGAELSGSQKVYYPTVQELVNGVIAGTVKAAFCYHEPPMSQLKRVTDVDDFPNLCALGGYGMMVKKGQTEFLGWWNDAFDKLTDSVEYRLICEDLKKMHGSVPGRPPSEVCLGY